MKFINWTCFSVIALLVVPQAVCAITHANIGGARSAPLTNASGTIERGGTITAEDRQGKTITVDGVTYPLVTTSTGVRHDLKKNTRIRFSTIKDRASGQEKVSEIWIVNSGGGHAKK